ncbi:MAG: mercury resistance system transport protein MerF [Rhodanobacter sp.]|nr:MAG: mercury resistance system transport protein MerF [Rhodanobacter sp.]
MQDPETRVRLGAIGSVLVALCCFTPILVILLGAVGLSALTGYLDYVLLPALVVFIGLTIYALWRKRRIDACCTTSGNGEKK